MKNQHPPNDNTVRVIKIGQDAIFELIYESFLDKKDIFFDVESVSCISSWAIDWENREFIFCVSKNSDDTPNSLHDEIDLEVVMRNIPDTTDTMFRDNRYREYTPNELIELSEKKTENF